MIYLASPYSHEDSKIRKARYLATCHAVWHLSEQNPREAIFSPIVYWHPVAEQLGLPTDKGFWRNVNRSFFDKSRELWILRLEGWESSKGLREEREWAEEENKPWRYV